MSKPFHVQNIETIPNHSMNKMPKPFHVQNVQTIEQIRALWNKRTSCNFAQILSLKPKPEVSNKKLIFI